MKAALIPPNYHLAEFGQGDLHLLLVHLCDSQTYVHHYELQRERGAYLILDNSAHEFSEGQDCIKIAAWAKRLNVQEVVVPDVLDNGPATVERAIEALEIWYETKSSLMSELNPALMYVPQGTKQEEYYDCMTELIRLHRYVAKKRGIKRDFVLGISKDYEDFPGGLDNILQTVEIVRHGLWEADNTRMHVHILGWHRHLWVLNDLAKNFSFVRSTDSAKPFVYALNNILLDPESDPPPYPGRHATAFFKKKMSAFQIDYAWQNCITFQRAANGDL